MLAYVKSMLNPPTLSVCTAMSQMYVGDGGGGLHTKMSEKEFYYPTIFVLNPSMANSVFSIVHT